MDFVIRLVLALFEGWYLVEIEADRDGSKSWARRHRRLVRGIGWVLLLVVAWFVVLMVSAWVQR